MKYTHDLAKDFKLLEKCYYECERLCQKGYIRTSINPTIVQYSDRKYFNGFFHYTDKNKKEEMFQFETVEDLLIEITRILNENQS